MVVKEKKGKNTSEGRGGSQETTRPPPCSPVESTVKMPRWLERKIMNVEGLSLLEEHFLTD
jgi:hypothetical protein